MDSSFHSTKIRLNASVVAQKIKRSSGSGPMTVAVEKTVRVNGTTDSIQVLAQQNTGSNVNLDSSKVVTFFEITRVG